MRETRTLEFKESINSNSFLKTISAFANYSNGEIILAFAMMELLKVLIIQLMLV